MNKRNLLVGGVWAAGTFALILGIFVPRGLQADNGAVRPTIVVPTLSAGGCDIVAHVVNSGDKNERGQYVFAAGQPLNIEVTATNTTPDQIEIPLDLTVSYFGQGSPMARSLPPPVIVRQATQELSLAPYESKTVTVADDGSGKPIPAGVTATLIGRVTSVQPAKSIMFQSLVSPQSATTQPVFLINQ